MPVAKAADFQVSIKNGPQPERASSALAEVRCNGCRGFFLKSLGVCPDCGQPRPGYNRWLHTAAVNAHTWQMVADAQS